MKNDYTISCNNYIVPYSLFDGEVKKGEYYTFTKDDKLAGCFKLGKSLPKEIVSKWKKSLKLSATISREINDKNLKRIDYHIKTRLKHYNIEIILPLEYCKNIVDFKKKFPKAAIKKSGNINCLIINEI